MRLLRIIVLFLFIYNPPLLSFNILHVIAGISYAFLLFNKRSLSLLLNVLKESKILLIAIFICLLSCILNNRITGFTNLFVILFEIIPICAVFISTDTSNQLVNDIIWASLIQSTIAILAFVFPSIQSAIVYRMIAYGYADVIETMSSWRFFGISRELTFAMPVTQSLVAGICLYKAINNSKYYLPIPFILFSSFINARTGIIVFAIISIVIVFSRIRFSAKSYVSTVFLVGVVVFSLSLFTSVLKRNQLAYEWVGSGIEDVTSFINGDSDTDNNSYFLYVTDKEKYILPDNVAQLLFGTGQRSQGTGNGYHSDIGYVNDIWYGGLIYMVLVLLYYISNSYRIVRCYSSDAHHPHLLCIGVITLLLIINIKGQLFTWNEFISFWFLLMTSMIARNRQKRMNKVL